MQSFQIGNLKIPVPIIQGGMGVGISLSGLASAFANAGGIGTIAAVGIGLIYGSTQKSFRQNNIEVITKEIRKARKLTKGILGVNIMSVLTNFNELVETVIKEKIDIIFSGAGLPLDLPKYKPASSDTKLVPIVSSGRAAKIIALKWKKNYNYLPDAFVVEGPNAGGHLGFSKKDLLSGQTYLEDLVKDVLKVVEDIKKQYNKTIPIIAAGGINNGQKIYKLMQIGASAVQVGTLFIATKECDASEKFKQVIINARQKDIKIIDSPVGLPGRAINSDFLIQAANGLKKPNSCKYHCIKTCNPQTTSFCIAEALHSAYQGNLNDGFVFSGAKSHEIDALSTVKDIFQKLITEYNAIVE